MPSVRYFGPDTDAFVDSVVRHADEFTQSTGRESSMWSWSLVMNARSKNKKNAWRFIEWAAGKEFLLRAAFEGSMNPTRRSTWDDPRFRETAAKWGDYYGVARQLLERDARVLVTPAPRYLKVADRWVQALRSAFAGNEGVAEALESAAGDIDAIVGAEV